MLPPVIIVGTPVSMLRTNMYSSSLGKTTEASVLVVLSSLLSLLCSSADSPNSEMFSPSTVILPFS